MERDTESSLLIATQVRWASTKTSTPRWNCTNITSNGFIFSMGISKFSMVLLLEEIGGGLVKGEKQRWQSAEEAIRQAGVQLK